MKLKERKKNYYLKKILNFIYELWSNKKKRVFFFLAVFIMVLLVGILIGLLISILFGTFDEILQGVDIEFKNAEIKYENQEISSIRNINAFFQESLPSQKKIFLYIGNLDPIPLEIVNLIYNDSIIFEINQADKIVEPKIFSKPVDYKKFEFEIPDGFIWTNNFSLDLNVTYKIPGSDDIKKESVFPWSLIAEDFLEKDFIRQKSNLSEIDMIRVNEDSKTIFIKKGDWKLNQSLIIPEGFSISCAEGTSIDLIKGATILSYSDLQFYGTKENPIKIFSSDKTGQGIAVLNAKKISNLKYVTFSDLTTPFKEGWELTGAVTFYESPFKFDNVIIKGMKAEDSLIGVGSRYEIKNSIFENCFSDCFDDDFGGGIIESSLFRNSGNDCIDISGSVVNIEDTKILNAGDKGVSVGEKSNVTIENIVIDNLLNKAYIGIASKDKSNVHIKNSQISNAKYGFAVYQKKSEFGPALINADNITLFNIENDYIVEEYSELFIDDIAMTNKEKIVYDKLYGI